MGQIDDKNKAVTRYTVIMRNKIMMRKENREESAVISDNAKFGSQDILQKNLHFKIKFMESVISEKRTVDAS
jgi:hypothetical protein